MGAIRLQGESSTTATSLKHPKKNCYKVRRLVFPQNSQKVKSVICSINWLKPHNTGKFETCLLQHRFHNNLNSSPIWNAPLASLRARLTAPFPSPWTTVLCKSPVRGIGRPYLAWRKGQLKSDVVKRELARSYVFLLACPILIKHGLHRRPWADDQDMEEHLHFQSSLFFIRQRDEAVPSRFHLVLEPLKCRTAIV